MSGQVLGWDCWGGDTGIKHANVVELGSTPEEAMGRLLERAVQKYCPQDRLTWEFRAEPIPKTAGAEIVRFVWHEGVLVRWSSCGGGFRYTCLGAPWASPPPTDAPPWVELVEGHC